MPQPPDIHSQSEPLRSSDRRYTLLLICSITLSAVLLCKVYCNSKLLCISPDRASQLASRDGLLFLQDAQKTQSNLKKKIGTVSPDLTPFFFQPLPVNFASAELLQTINGIGPRMAEEIVKVRSTKGFFISATALGDVPGIGPKRIKQFKNQISFATRP